MGRFVRALMAAAALVAGVCGFGLVLLDEGDVGVSPTTSLQARPIVREGSLSESRLCDELHYRSLNESQQLAYRALYEGISARMRVFDIQVPDAGDIEAALHAIMADHPEFFWLSGACTYQPRLMGEVHIELGYNLPEDGIAAAQASIDAAAATYLAALPDDATTYDKVKLAYEWVITTTDYGYDSVQNQNIQSVLIDHVSVCAGYAKAFQYLLGLADVSCAYVRGTIVSAGIEHAWNVVDIDGTLTYVDVTWGDPTYASTSGGSVTGNITYDYLCLTTEEMQRCGHVVAASEPAVACDSGAYDYYGLNGLLFDAYDKEQAEAAFRATYDAGGERTSLKFTNDEAYAAARAALEDTTMLDGTFVELAAARQGGGDSVSYQRACDDALRIVTVLW